MPFGPAGMLILFRAARQIDTEFLDMKRPLSVQHDRARFSISCGVPYFATYVAYGSGKEELRTSP